MGPYAMDLRHTVLDAYDRGDGSQRQLAARFGLATSTVQSWLDRRRTTGAVAPLKSGAPSPKIDDAAPEVSRQARRMGLTRKKRLLEPQSTIAAT
jgi:transposase